MNDDDGYPCPVCEQLTLGEEGGYDICPVCGWEDDPSQKVHPDFGGGANVLSLNEYRKNYYTKKKTS